MKRIFLTLTTLFLMMHTIYAQEKLSDMTEAQRNAELTAIAKATFQKEMPEVYREYGKPTFERCTIKVSPSSYQESLFGGQYGDIYYIVTFPMNPETETSIFFDGYACKVHIWDDIKKAFLIRLGNTEGWFKVPYKRPER